MIQQENRSKEARGTWWDYIKEDKIQPFVKDWKINISFLTWMIVSGLLLGRSNKVLLAWTVGVPLATVIVWIEYEKYEKWKRRKPR